ncbi:RanGTP-binding protein-domain-containing protein [Xylariomycetidae sp. FL0641]|nr:RanGTP-binding protein-domain-containing protein [Xylariomycetidae sp. FL0641]
MDAFLAKISVHATNYAIRSCIALTSTYVVKQSSRLLQTVDDDPLRAELTFLQRRLARKIELVSPILESIELRYTRGDVALESVVRTARGLREDIDALGERLKLAALPQESPGTANRRPSSSTGARRTELLGIIAEIKELIVNIDDAVPLINLWVSAIGGIQAPSSAFSPSRLLQASMLVNVGDTQFVLDPSRPMQIGPDFTLSLYMLFRGHASDHGDEEPYGLEDGQRRPVWQEVIHKARVRLYRVPVVDEALWANGSGDPRALARYAYQLRIVEDLDDGRVHSLEDGKAPPSPFDGIALAGIREFVPVFQISKMFYADVGKILNINNDEGASSNPVLLLKRDVDAVPVATTQEMLDSEHPGILINGAAGSVISDGELEEGDTQFELDRQIREESEAPEDKPSTELVSTQPGGSGHSTRDWRLPQDLDPEWLALEVFDINDDDESSDTEDDSLSEPGKPTHTKSHAHLSVDSNLVTQLNRMNLATSSSRPSSQAASHVHSRTPSADSQNIQHHHNPTQLSPTKLIERSPFGAIKTSLSLLEMLLRLTSLQEFEQTTHLAIPDHVLRFYIEEGAGGSAGGGFVGGGRETERKVGFDPYARSGGG